MRNILHVDHEANIGRLVKLNLDKAGYDLTTVQALDDFFAKLDGIDLVIIGDIDAQSNENWKVLGKLKSNADTRDIPVMMLTKRSLDREVLRCWQGGADCYLTKPFNPLEVVSFVKRIFASLKKDDD